MSRDDTSKLNIDPLESADLFTFSDKPDIVFDTSGSHDSANEDDTIIDLTELTRHMDCICPKCSKKSEVDLDLIPETGFRITCSSCNTNIHIIKESSACRAKRQSLEINCANCGELLDHHAHCHSCGKLFPDHFVAVNPDDARRKARNDYFSSKWAAITTFKLSFKSSSAERSHETTHGYSPQRVISSATATSSVLSRKIALFLIIAIALTASGVFAYNNYLSGKTYTENYIKALYCIKIGIDTNLKSCSATKAEWETASASGQRYSPVIINKDEAGSVKRRSDIEKYLQQLGKTPKKFELANDKLTALHKIYLSSDALQQSKPGSLQDLSNSINSLNKEMTKTSQDLKSSLPDSLKQELESAKLKYRGLKDF